MTHFNPRTGAAVPERANYHWRIVKDYLADPDESQGTNANAVGVEGPRNFDPDVKMDKRFKMLDDDGEIYYRGVYGGPDGEEMFGPLDDFGAPNAGCTEIWYWNGFKWEML